MKPFRILAVILALLAVVSAQNKYGLHPRSSAADYPVSRRHADMTIAAAQLSPKQVNRSFATDLNAGDYMVVEIGIFPASEKPVTVDPQRFMLRSGKDDIVRPASPQAIAASQQRPEPSGGRDVTLYPTAGVGYETGTDPYGGRISGTTTSVGLGVGIGPKAPPAASTRADRNTMETELTDKGLPAATSKEPFAGYLYFPIVNKKATSYVLEYSDQNGTVKLSLTSAGK